MEGQTSVKYQHKSFATAHNGQERGRKEVNHQEERREKRGRGEIPEICIVRNCSRTNWTNKIVRDLDLKRTMFEQRIIVLLTSQWIVGYF